ncbi:MAG: hypothetical protein COC19_01585 [SAR86 cluster bacterium]|uniref:DUF1330 domain-containing protein n=1 Tax=SAR86 cluster bacterium TaxID=2030880 RepID=A0A2A4MTJ1_9GAMM|nr:MAG: hypothetical protein COC19_01585 [SAR86 cluster bacterium]
MSDIAVTMIANLVVNNADEYRKYEKGFFPILKKHGGEFISYDDNSLHLEGESPLQGRIILFSFPSASAAQAWYADPDYQALSQHRRVGTVLKSLTMVNGLPPRN